MTPSAATAAVVISLIVCSACSATAPNSAAPTPVGAGATWERHIDAFSVLDADGEAYAYPLLGGFNVPRPQFVDIDGDGDLDLFVQERPNEVMFFENRSIAQVAEGSVGGAAAPQLVWRTDRFQDLDVGEWFRFVDLDGDGDPDLLAEQPYSLIRYYRNDAGRFTLAADTLRDTDGRPIFSDRQNIPNVTDIDCDRRPDLFIGRLTGHVMRYEATEPVRDVPPAFRFVTDRFEDIEIIAEFVGAGQPSLHGANTMVFADIDADGDQDLFWGDFFEAGILLIENAGSCESPSLRGQPVPFPRGEPVATSGFNVPTVADLNGDGELDVLIGVLGGAYNPDRTAADNLYLLESAGVGYELRTRRFLSQIDLGTETAVAAGDIDGDGDLDLLVAPKLDPDQMNTSRIVVFENIGTAPAPAFRLADMLDLAGHYHFAPHLTDIDADGDLDLLLGTWNRGVLIVWNEGNVREPRWVLADEPLVILTRGSNSVPAAADIDGDGDLDLIVGEASGALNLFENVGTPGAPRFEMVSDEYGGIDVGRRSAPTFTDLDGDGRPDLVVGSEDGGPACFRNTGPLGDGFQPFETCGLPRLLPLATPVFADLDGDGDNDLLAGTLHGGIVYFAKRARGK